MHLLTYCRSLPVLLVLGKLFLCSETFGLKLPPNGLVDGLPDGLFDLFPNAFPNRPGDGFPNVVVDGFPN